ncbi:hypothetical protein WN48_05228 [Eufriesea mexicana]|uniref:TIL domain-containing protein n=1 Tax=Eufriesea mexicana TaxID=516756 RepID=A0A310S8Q1_9HYME|nr:PREDICTED: cysteine-rich venom protein 1-like [Eufriesea mexicana]OAD54564.1 hypothetical protein WN48_05228 [Eufriesea mexicana]
MSPYMITCFILAIAAVPLVQSAENAPECPVNQIWSLCGRLCEPSCDDPKPNPLFCPRIACSNYTAACRCIKGTVRNANDECVPVDQCPKKE